MTCEDAVAAAITALPAFHPSITTIEFHYGSWCPPGEGCQAPRSDIGFVVFTFVVGTPSFVRVIERPVIGVVAVGGAMPFPPDL
jgi:hypothetical protein